MSKFSKEYIQDLGKQIKIAIPDEACDDLAKEFEVLDEVISVLDEIDTEGIEPMIYPFDEPTSYLREDDVEKVLPVSDVLANAPKVSDDQIVVPKVVK